MNVPTERMVIDADAHVVEADHTWDFLEPSEAKYRPVLAPSPIEPERQAWLVDGKPAIGFVPDFPDDDQIEELSVIAGRNMGTPQPSRYMKDVDQRLRHMDELGIDVQILHNSMWLLRLTDDPDAELALCRAWNRWLGDIWRRGAGRLRWSCVVPVLTLDAAVSEVRSARDNGAVAVFMRPFDGNRVVTDPYFYPVYEVASELGMSIAVHIANGNKANCDLFMSMNAGISTQAFAITRAPTMMACMFLLMSEIPQVFPNLRWGFIESSAQWMPWVHNEAARRYRAEGKEFPEDVFREYNVFVTCQNDDDLPWILKYAGDASLVIGTDYGHTDQASEVDAIEVFRKRGDIEESLKKRILHDNPKALYGL